MKRRAIGTITCFVLSLLLFAVWHMNFDDRFATLLLYVNSLSVICFICFGVTLIFAWRKSDISPYWIFAVTDILLMGLAGFVAYINIHNAKDDYDGLFGGLIIVVVIPMALLALIGNSIVSKFMEDK